MSRSRAFAQVDVFSRAPYSGNPVAVVLDAEGLSETEMARFANWTNLSETTFVLPPSHDPDTGLPVADYRLRIFTPTRELPFAGHPTLGSAAAWLHAGGVPRNPGTIVQECGVGLVELRQGAGSGTGTATGTGTGTPDHLGESLAFAAPDLLRSGPLDEDYVAQIATALGIDRTEILDHAWVDNGPGWAAVRLNSATQVLALTPDFSAIPEAKLGVVGAHPRGSEHEYEVRAFVPGVGVAEDPVTGSLGASVAQWLIASGLAPDSYTATQGTAIGRAGVISILRDPDPGSREGLGTVWVGGPTIVCVSGTVYA